MTLPFFDIVTLATHRFDRVFDDLIVEPNLLATRLPGTKALNIRANVKLKLVII